MVDDIHNEKDDSENITWHYEADYEALNDDSIKMIYISGPRAEDLKYRLLLGDIPQEKIITGRYEKDIIEKIDFSQIDTLLIFYDMYRYDMLEKEIKPAIISAAENK